MWYQDEHHAMFQGAVWGVRYCKLHCTIYSRSWTVFISSRLHCGWTDYDLQIIRDEED
ncbi:unnamed protein product [Brassica oleracea]